MTASGSSSFAGIERVTEYLGRVERLRFALPPFRRIAWVSEPARRTWLPVLERIAGVRLDVFAHAVSMSEGGAGAVDVLPAEKQLLARVVADRELVARPMAYKFGSGMPPPLPGRERFLLAVRTAAERVQHESADRRLAVLWDHLAMPDCCRDFEIGVRRPFQLTDDLLARALNTAGARLDARTVQIAGGGLLSPIFGLLGIALVSHSPCSFSCPESSWLGEAWIAAGHELGFDTEMDALVELSEWPLGWSALHGIAEIRVPVLKATSNTIATAVTHTVECEGSRIPLESASGLRFPFIRSNALRITESASFGRGLSNTAHAPAAVAQPVASPVRRRTVASKPIASTIVDETFDLLQQKGQVVGRNIEAVHLSGYFNTIRLDDGSTGSCMSYYRFRTPAGALQSTREVEVRLASDPLLLDYLFSGPPDFLRLSLRACLVSALSAPLIAVADGMEVGGRFDRSVFDGSQCAVVLGFGGYLDFMVQQTTIPEIHLSDFSYHRRAEHIDRRLADYRVRYPEKTITVSSGFDAKERIAAADLVSITGSALCNGTMEEMLDMASGCRTVIVQGQSGAIHPERLFARGVSLISTSLKPATLIDVARSDPAEFRRLLVVGLPKVYLTPRPAQESESHADCRSTR